MNETSSSIQILINPFTTGDKVQIPQGRSKRTKTIHVHSVTEHYAYTQLAFDGETIEIVPGELIYSTGKLKWDKVPLTEEIIKMNNLVPRYREVLI